MKNQKGFTLIELLLVLAIIGIISAIAIPALLGQREKAKIKAVQSMVANVAAECARVNDDLRQAAGGTVPSQDVVDAVLKLPNFNLPAAKNPYGGTGNPYISGAATSAVLGQVGLKSDDAFKDPAVVANTYHAVVINGFYTEGGKDVETTKVVALD
jgi:prepilin-type N-terminal cleavage/methylation domain-containing protein